ncbi:hypothetical protein PUN28_017800 [Cardiocondyla obscurior]|uniref:Uncharacterized protein n=1 Tax=Cardiocondyla obscurior TaxID=286306 RepID=A0AAW2ELV6_9HYME
MGKRKKAYVPRKRITTDGMSPAEKIAALDQKEQSVLDVSVPLPVRTQQRAERLKEDYLDECRSAPSRDLACCVLSDMVKVLRVSGVSKRLKGEYAKALRACRTRASVTMLLTRLTTDGLIQGAESTNLVQELQQAKNMIRALQEEVTQLRNTLASVSPQSPASKKRREDTEPTATTQEGNKKPQERLEQKRQSNITVPQSKNIRPQYVETDQNSSKEHSLVWSADLGGGSIKQLQGKTKCAKL